MDAELYRIFNLAEENHWWFVARRKYIEVYLSRYIPTTGALKLAEIGSGTGGNFTMISRFGELDAVEMDERAIQLARDKVDSTHRVMSISSGWLPDNIPLDDHYDCVLALDVIEHVEDDGAAVESLVSLLKPAGWLLITVPAYGWLWSGHDELNHHYRRYTAGRLKKLFSGMNVKLLNIGYFNTLLFPLAVLRRLGQKINSKAADAQDDLKIPGALLNQILKGVFLIESKWAGLLSMPFGLSVICIVQRK